MSFRRLLSIWICALFACGSAFAEDVTYVSMSDDVVDIYHPDISPYIDRGALASIELPWSEEGETLLDVIEAELEKRKDHTELSHGTKVALVFLNASDPKRVKLIPFPSFVVSRKEKENRSNFDKCLTAIRNVVTPVALVCVPTVRKSVFDFIEEYYEWQSGVLRDYSVKIYNESKSPRSSAIRVPILRGIGDDLKRAQEKFVDDNPQTLFVLGSGNDREEITPVSFHGLAREGVVGNLIYVAANGAGDRLEDYSNFSPDYVEVAARAGGDKYPRLNGTSFSSPHFGNLGIQLSVQDQTLLGSQLKQKMLDVGTLPVSKLEGLVKGARSAVNHWHGVATKHMFSLGIGVGTYQSTMSLLEGIESNPRDDSKKILPTQDYRLMCERIKNGEDTLVQALTFFEKDQGEKKGPEFLLIRIKGGQVYKLTPASGELKQAFEDHFGLGQSGCGPALDSSKKPTF